MSAKCTRELDWGEGLTFVTYLLEFIHLCVENLFMLYVNYTAVMWLLKCRLPREAVLGHPV